MINLIQPGRFAAAPPPVSGSPLITGFAGTTVVAGGTYSGWRMGMGFDVGASPLVVTQLGRMVLTGNSQNHTVRLVRQSDSVEVASAVVPTAGRTVGQYSYTDLASSVTLPAGGRFFLVSDENSDTMYEVATVTVASGKITNYGAGYRDASGNWTIWPGGVDNKAWVPPNLKFA